MADTLDRFVPALSATSDMPDMVPAETVSEPATSATSDMPVVEKVETAPAADAATSEGAAGADPDQGETRSGKESPEPVADPPVFVEDKGPRGVGKALEAQRAEIAAERARATAAEARAAEAIRAMEALTARLPAPKAEAEAPADPRPTREGFEDPVAYDAALIDWSGRQAARAVKTELETQATVEKAKAEREASEATAARAREEITIEWNDRKAKAAEKYADFVEVTSADDLPISQAMADTIVALDNGTEVAYYLGKHTAEAKRIASLNNPIKQVAEIGRLAERLTVAPKSNVTKAPDPIRPMRASTAPANTKGIEDMSMEEYAAKRQSDIAASRRRPGAAVH